MCLFTLSKNRVGKSGEYWGVYKFYNGLQSCEYDEIKFNKNKEDF